MPTPTIAHRSTRRPSALTGRGLAVVLLARVRDNWPNYTPSQRAECADILERLAACLRRAPSSVRVPLLARITA